MKGGDSMNTEIFLGEKLYTIGRVTIDKSFHTQHADEAFFRYFGNDVIYSIRRTINDDDFLRLEDCINTVRPGELLRTAVRMKGTDGEMRWLLAGVRLLGEREGGELYTLTLSDICSLEAIAYERESRLSEYRHILSMMSDLAFEYSFTTNIIRIYMFDCFRELVLIKSDIDEWKKSSVEAGYIPSRYTEAFERLCTSIKNGIYRFDFELESSLFTQGKSVESCLFRGITRYDDPENRKVTGIITMVNTRQKAKNVNLAIEVNRDPLSELLNKRAIDAHARELITSKPGCNVNLIMLDIDDFTMINNSYGHLFGDEVIHTIAGIVKTEIGNRGYAGRISGGGFLIVAEDTKDETDLRGILRAIRTKTEWAFTERFENFRLTCSMGVSTYPIDSENYDELFMQADKALYIAKEKGKNRYVIYDINKHGPVEKDIENKIAYLSSKKDVSEKLSFIGNLTEELVFGTYPDTIVLLEQLRSVFGIDDVCVFAGNDMKLVLSCGNAQAKNALYILENNYTDRFSGDGIFVIDNVNELEGRDDNAMGVLLSQNIGGAVQYLITDEGIIKGMISFCYIDRFKKWAVADANYLTIAARTISAILKKKSYI